MEKRSLDRKNLKDFNEDYEDDDEFLKEIFDEEELEE